MKIKIVLNHRDAALLRFLFAGQKPGAHRYGSVKALCVSYRAESLSVQADSWTRATLKRLIKGGLICRTPGITCLTSRGFDELAKLEKAALQ